jgi:hypothetical protein
MVAPHRVLLVDRVWAHHRLIVSAIRERFPHVAVHCVGSAAQARARLSNGRFDLVLVERGIEDVTGDSPATVKVFDAAPSRGRVAVSPRLVEITQLVEQHLKG